MNPCFSLHDYSAFRTRRHFWQHHDDDGHFIIEYDYTLYIFYPNSGTKHVTLYSLDLFFRVRITVKEKAINRYD
jgi:hypothetical protein